MSISEQEDKPQVQNTNSSTTNEKSTEKSETKKKTDTKPKNNGTDSSMERNEEGLSRWKVAFIGFVFLSAAGIVVYITDPSVFLPNSWFNSFYNIKNGTSMYNSQRVEKRWIVDISSDTNLSH